MAAREIVNSYQTDVESIVNRWFIDYYLFLAIDLFKNEHYSDFCGIRDILESVLVRPLESTDSMPTKIRVIQLLSRIYEGERLDLSFESDESMTPLESALMLLENMNQEYNMPQPDFENVCTSVKEMIVGIFIKNNEFDKAKEVINKHFPKPMVGKKAIFMGLINQKSKVHDVIEQIDFQRFKEEMCAFCLRICPLSVPFLHKAAIQLIDKRLVEEDDEADDEPGPSSGPQINTVQFLTCKHAIIQRTRLEAAYKALAAGSDEGTFAQLEEEVESEEQVKTKKRLSLHLSPTPRKVASQDLKQEGLFQRDSGSPMEATPADHQPQTGAVPPTQARSLSKTPIMPRNKQLYTVARLVVEPDSQGSSQCTTTPQQLETEVTTEEPAQTLDISNKKDLQSPGTDREVTISTRKRPRKATKPCSRSSPSLPELTADSEEEPPSSVANGEVSVRELHTQTNSSQSRNTESQQLSSDSEEDEEDGFKTPLRKPRKKLASDPKDPGNTDYVCVTNTSLDASPNLFPLHPIPQTSSTPQKDPVQDPGPFQSKWKRLLKNATESKDTWNEEDTLFKQNSGPVNESTISNSSQRKKWTEIETQKLKDGVKKFGEGNWSKIRTYYSFENRTNVNLKDRWRTLKRSNMV